MNRIAIVGKMHAGKTTLAQFLVEDHNFTRVSFAEPVKTITADMLTTFMKHFPKKRKRYFTLDDVEQYKGHPTIRRLLQVVGDDLGREWLGSEDTWVERLADAVYTIQDEYDEVGEPCFIVCDDARRPNEVARLQELGFVIIRLQRKEEERINSVRQEVREYYPNLTDDEVNQKVHRLLSHPSERDVERIRKVIDIDNINLAFLRYRIAPAMVGRGRRNFMTEFRSHTGLKVKEFYDAHDYRPDPIPYQRGRKRDLAL